MALHWPTFFTRLGSAIVFCTIMMAGLLWNEWAFFGLALLIQFLCLRDYLRLMRKIQPDPGCTPWLPVLTHTSSLVLLGSCFYYTRTGEWVTAFAALVPLFILLPAVLKKQTALPAAIQSLSGLLYIALPLSLFVLMRHQNFVLPLALVLMIWMNDTMAYLVGSFIGRTPFSKISPKKTWEGTAGGAVLTLAGAAAWGYYAHDYRMIDWMALALCSSVAGTAGDLLESKLKRLADVKDSGALMPGHGGALDRFDSLLVAIPFAYAYAFVFMTPLPQ